MPGKLTSFEELMLCQHTTGFPCEFFIRLRFQGHLSPERFEQAVLDAASRHPLLAAGIVFRSNRPYWSSHAQLRSSVVWCDGEDSNAARAMPALDISRQGFAIWVQRDQGCSDVWLQMHHACCDGLGGYQFVRDILLLYAHGAASLADATREAVPALPRVDAKLLSRRGGFNMSSWEFLRMLPRQLVGVLGVREYLSRRPLPLLPHRPAALESVRDVYPTVLSNQFTLPVSQRLGRLAHSESATSNELYYSLHSMLGERGVVYSRSESGCG